MCIPSFAHIDGMNDGKSKFLFSLLSAFEFLNEISVKVILVYRLSLPCYHVAVVQVILIGTPFKILRSIVSLYLVFVIDNQSILVTGNEVQGYKPMNLIVCIVPTSITQRNAKIPFTFVHRWIQHPAFKEIWMFMVCPPIKASHPSHVADLVATLEAFHVFPNLFNHGSVLLLVFKFGEVRQVLNIDEQALNG